MREHVERWSLILGFAFFVAHELDAVFNLEWRVLPVTSFLADEPGRVSFVLLHVPMMAALAYFLWEAAEPRRRVARVLFTLFCVAHVVLHWLYSDDPEYRFESWDANLLILGAGIFGAIYLATVLLGKKTSPPG